MLFKAFNFDYAKVLIILNNVPTISNVGGMNYRCNILMNLS